MADLIVIAILIAFGYLTLKAASSALKKDSPNSSETRTENKPLQEKLENTKLAEIAVSQTLERPTSTAIFESYNSQPVNSTNYINVAKGDDGLVEIPMVSEKPDSPVIKPIEVPKPNSQHSEDYANQVFAEPYGSVNPDNDRSHIKELLRHRSFSR